MGLFVACRSATSERAAGSSVPALTPVRAEFGALQAALATGDDETAARLVDQLAEEGLAREERAQLEGARKVLRGRALVAGLELRLASEELADTPGRYELVLRARNRNVQALTLALPPADLRRQRATIDARGLEGVEFESKLCKVLSALELAPGREQRFVILSYELPLGRALAVRERWRLVARSGELRVEGERLPAAAVAVEGCARERVSPLVAGGAGDGELATLLAGPSAPSARSLLEAALVLPLERREATLTALTPLVRELARSDPERVRTAEPALRWLTENRDLGADPAAWAHYLATRGTGAPDGQRARLDLPGSPR